MALISRRVALKGALGFGLGLGGVAAYACGVEPELFLNITRYHLTPPGWPPGLRLKIAVVSDIHACEPWMSAAHVRQIALATNALAPDIVALLGDFNAGHNLVSGPVLPEQWGEALSILRAPLGVYAILGNHDWWHGALPRMRGDEGESVRRALRGARFQVMENDAIRLEKAGAAFWIVGLADQMAYEFGPRQGRRGADDLGGALKKVTDDAPVILLAHEPYIFRRVPDRVALTLSGHTHGEQINLPLVRDAVDLMRRRVRQSIYGHSLEGSRHLIISAGLGSSVIPARLLRPPEIVEVNLGADPALSAL